MRLSVCDVGFAAGVLALLSAASAAPARAEFALGPPLPLAPATRAQHAPAGGASLLAWSASVGSLADQLRIEGRMHLGPVSAGLGALSRVGAEARPLRYDGVVAGMRAERGAFAIDVDWIDYGAHTTTRLVGGMIVADSVLIPAREVREPVGYPTRGIVLGARYHRAPFALGIRTVTRDGADRGRLLPGQATAELELGRAAILAGFGRPTRSGGLGYEPQAFVGLSLGLGPGATANAPAAASGAASTEPAFCALRSGGQIRFEVAAPGARRVELATDVNGWEPLALAPAGPGRWEGLLAAHAGTLRVLMRLDGGAWQPPPGLPVAREPTTGDVGILIVGG